MPEAHDTAEPREVAGASRAAWRFLAALAAPDLPRLSSERVAVIVAHPDDETIGVGGQLSRFANMSVVHVTDGAPRDHPDRTAYARTRRRELETAMAMVGIPAQACISLGLIDQEASLHLASLAERLQAFFEERRIEIVLTHPYEGGHPDHDATAFAVHGARALMERRAMTPPAIIEMAFYHAGRGGLRTQEFAGARELYAIEVPLSTAAWALKRRMLAAHVSQVEVLAQFGARIERFREAPAYDFCAPPNDGAVHYEANGWGISAQRWCQLASEAQRQLLGLEPC